jgi:hypothetical protein
MLAAPNKRSKILRHCPFNLDFHADMLNNLVDESDPDLDLPNIVHAFQTAERIRYTDLKSVKEDVDDDIQTLLFQKY